MKSRYARAATLAGAVLVLDLLSKWLVMARLELWESRPVIAGFFDLVHATNKGAAFGFLNRVDITWQTAFLIAVNLAAVALMLHILRRASERETFLVTGLGLILGGALGNLIDRIRFGQVVDFLDFYVGDWHWPAFNVADMGISLGAFCLILSLYQKKPHASGTR
jgi:signal peptidase II